MYHPSKIICVGLNYRDHAAELAMPLPVTPIIFMKPPTTIIHENQAIIYPAQTNNLHYEAELGVVIKNRIKGITEAQAAKNIAGFVCANDVTARDLQNQDGQWTRAKSFDTFCPLGSRPATGINPDDLGIKLLLNGQVKQQSRTSNMIFKVNYLVAFIASIMTLEPGDVIITGTPPGVGPMRPGDTVAVEIEGVGRLENRVLA